MGLAVLHAAAGDPDSAQKLLGEAIDLGGEAAREAANRYPVLTEALAKVPE